MIELTVVLLLVSLIYAWLTLAIKPDEVQRRSRDVVRLADLGKLATVVESFVADKGVPPDLANTTRSSLNAVGSGPLAKADGEGWIGEDLSKYLENLPLDPLNVNPFFYRYRQNGLKYEVDAVLEYHTSLMTEDGGNASGRYEKGTDLTIL